MAEIVSFPTRDERKKKALDVLAGRIAAHMAEVFYHRNILHIPVQAYARGMVEVMMADGMDYSAEVLDQIGTDHAALTRLETVFIDILVAKGVLTT